MAKTNPFIKGLSPAELAKLRRKAPYVDQVYNPKTNEVNYDIILRRLNDTSKKISDVEANFINQVKRNLQREYWREGVAAEALANGEIFDIRREHGLNYAYDPTQERVNKQRTFMQALYKSGAVSDYRAAFENSDILNLPVNPSFYNFEKRQIRQAKIKQFMPEDLNRYAYQKGRGPKLLRTFPGRPDLPRYEKYYDDAAYEADKYVDNEQIKSNMTTLEKIFNSITSGVENVNRVYAENKARKEEERQNAINRAIKAEAAVASYQRKEKFDREQFDRALADKDKAYNERFEQANAEFKKLIDARDTAYKAETAKRTAEFDSWRKSFESSSIEQAKQQAEQHTKEMSQLRAESVRQAQDLANAKVETERIKSQNAILLKNNTRRRIALKQMGNIGLNFVGAGQRDSQSTALLSVLAGKNRYVPVARRFNEYGRFVESRGDTAVPDTFLSLISPQPQNRRK